MQRKQGLVPVAEALADLPGPVQALIPSPPAQRHFTRFDQVNLLVGASEADADRGFMARTMALCSLPRTNPGAVYLSFCNLSSAQVVAASMKGGPEGRPHHRLAFHAYLLTQKAKPPAEKFQGSHGRQNPGHHVIRLSGCPGFIFFPHREKQVRF